MNDKKEKHYATIRRSSSFGSSFQHFSYEDIETLINHFKEEGYNAVAFESGSPYDSFHSEHKRVNIDDLKLEDVQEWQKSGSGRCIRGFRKSRFDN